MAAYEINFDGIVGPTHNYAGLSYGNLASMRHRKTVSNPRQAALEGLAKMKFLMKLGIRQAVLPPQERPHLQTLRKLGFSGSDAQILEKAHKVDPALLASVCSASSMWAANAATVSPSADCADDRVHFTPANLIGNFHRSIEAPMTERILRTIFADESSFTVHPSLPAAQQFGDEGAANHTRLCSSYDQPGIEIFTFGRAAFDASAPAPKQFPARQTLEASKTIARMHQLDPARTMFVQQNPDAIDAGAFHNDVVAIGNLNFLLHHQRAYLNLNLPTEWRRIEVDEAHVPLADAISTYLFNSQLVILPNGSMTLIAPVECRENLRVSGYIGKRLMNETPIKSAHFVDVRQSMSNGGGPACLRLRVVLTEAEIGKMRGNVLLTEALLLQLESWVEKHYRDHLIADDLRDPELLKESRDALNELTGLLALPAIYEFQK